MKIAIYKSRAMGTADVIGNVEVDLRGVTIKSDTKELVRIIKLAIRFPAKIKTISGKTATKRRPKDLAEHVRNSLKMRLTNPYWIGPKFMELEAPKYEETIGSAKFEHVVHPVEVS
jgi:hypothetical protein